jgi:hypothetical protein
MHLLEEILIGSKLIEKEYLNGLNFALRTIDPYCIKHQKQLLHCLECVYVTL